MVENALMLGTQIEGLNKLQDSLRQTTTLAQARRRRPCAGAGARSICAGWSSSAAWRSTWRSSYAYEVHVRPDADSGPIVAGQAAVLQAGMTVQADIKTDRRRVIEFFLSSVIKYMDERMKVR